MIDRRRQSSRLLDHITSRRLANEWIMLIQLDLIRLKFSFILVINIKLLKLLGRTRRKWSVYLSHWRDDIEKNCKSLHDYVKIKQNNWESHDQSDELSGDRWEEKDKYGRNVLLFSSYKCESYTNYSRNKTLANEATLDTGTGWHGREGHRQLYCSLRATYKFQWKGRGTRPLSDRASH